MKSVEQMNKWMFRFWASIWGWSWRQQPVAMLGIPELLESRGINPGSLEVDESKPKMIRSSTESSANKPKVSIK